MRAPRAPRAPRTAFLHIHCRVSIAGRRCDCVRGRASSGLQFGLCVYDVDGALFLYVKTRVVVLHAFACASDLGFDLSVLIRSVGDCRSDDVCMCANESWEGSGTLAWSRDVCGRQLMVLRYFRCSVIVE